MPTKTSELLAAAVPPTVALVQGTGDDQLDLPTPCADYTVRGLVNHVYDVAVNFQRLAARQEADWSAKTDHVAEPGWRDRFAAEVAQLVVAWDDPASEEGVVPGMGLSRSTLGLMGVVDLVVHGWDLARATGQPYEPAPESVAAVRDFMAEMGPMGRQMGAFGPEVPIDADRSELDRLLGSTGRDPAWTR
ncbi:TIGR03086 family metal-binding protein [Micromonospora sp. WMMD987]|uniref:TIGR03086 family metal-binding protein n=1 Tax=Micromonospora sp. WMMD987 TaxID=3016089 RepID=UPI00249C7FF4|nr:TIGR03086 family metal-binding protein [Micromonospora sp. WMMD987]WFE95842.1 TIGR03086 family metal-binding protein [Micromonospora sp. WMMD987]